MKSINKLFLSVILVTFLILTLPGHALAAPPVKVVIGGTFTLQAGETLDEALTVVGGSVVLEEGSTVNGKIIVLGGSLDINGTVNGDVVATGGYVKLGESAEVNGDITSAGGYVGRDEGAQVSGEIQTEMSGPFPLLLPGLGKLPPIDVSFSPVWEGLWFLTQVLVLSALAVLAAMFFTKPLERVNHALSTQTLMSGSMGLLTGFIAPFVVLFMVITICLIPAALLGMLLLGFMLLVGWVAFGLEVGKRLGVLLKQEWAAPIAAGVGTFTLTLVIGGVGRIWCIGWLFPTVVALIGLGAVILTRIGSQDYPETVRQGTLAPATPVTSPQPEQNEPAAAPDDEQGPAEGI